MKPRFIIDQFKCLSAVIAAIPLWLCQLSASAITENDFNSGWRFVWADEQNAEAPAFDDRSWETVALPHTARVEALVMGDGEQQWQGICWYRKTFDLPADAGGKVIILKFEGAMNIAEVWVNGRSAGRFMGGYLPYVMDISQHAKPDAENVIAVRLDNRDNPITGPKPLKDLDFNLYGGLYRTARLIIKDPLHITDPILADKVASGGVFVTFPEVTKESATVRVQTHLCNADVVERTVVLKTALTDTDGTVEIAVSSEAQVLAPGTDREVVQEIHVSNPNLWSPGSPYLHVVRSELIENGRVVDTEHTRIGIRRIEITKDGFWINGEKLCLRGVNRHQEYPYIGNAVPAAAQYRDALKIKQAGFDYVRLAHYPQSPDFMHACDELGLVVMNCLMGWQYFNRDPAFAELKYEETRQLIRRDRNHPSVILWEVSLNESRMPREFIRRTHAIAHEEYPGDQMYTCGWTDGYDVFIQARQHGGCNGVTNRPCVVSEYGDWEYYAQNAGLAQHEWKDLEPDERNSRQLRGHGEVRLLQQALNFQEAHNDNLKTTAFADGIWVMFDYNRGYADDIEASGVMDIFRLPKFGYYFFRSQRDPEEIVAGKPVGPMVFIANYWTAGSPTEVRVFSNCDEVELLLNERPIERRGPDTNRFSTHLKHPPFTFTVDQFEPGVLRAVGYIDGKPAVMGERRTPGEPVSLTVRFDLGGHPFAKRGKDAVFCRAELRDAAGTLVPNAEVPVFFGASGANQLVGHNPILSEAGIATNLLQGDATNASLYALCLVQTNGTTRVLSAAGARPGSSVAVPIIRYTTDGSEPTTSSPIYESPITGTENVRVALFINDQRIVSVDSHATAPSTRPTVKAASTGDKGGE